MKARLRVLAAAAIAALAIGLLGLLGPTSGVAAHPRPVVAVALSASHGITVGPEGGKRRALQRGTTIRYGEIVFAGRGARAKVRITVPKGDPGKRNLVVFRSVKKAHHTLKVTRHGRVIEVILKP